MLKKATLALCTAGGISMFLVQEGSALQLPPPSITPPVTIDAVSSTQERADLSKWIKDTHDVLRSKAFLDNLSALAVDYSSISFGARSGTPAELATIMKMQTPYRYFPTPVALVGNQWNATAATGHNGERVNTVLVTSMGLGRQHFSRYRSSNEVERSCAINTMAHEMSHLITDHAQWATGVFEDTGAGAPIGSAKPIASYLIGSVAQCTYLQNGRRIGAADLRACVATFGDSEFNNGRCDQFAAGDAVQWPKKPPRP